MYIRQRMRIGIAHCLNDHGEFSFDRGDERCVRYRATGNRLTSRGVAAARKLRVVAATRRFGSAVLEGTDGVAE